MHVARAGPEIAHVEQRGDRHHEAERDDDADIDHAQQAADQRQQDQDGEAARRDDQAGIGRGVAEQLLHQLGISTVLPNRTNPSISISTLAIAKLRLASRRRSTIGSSRSSSQTTNRQHRRRPEATAIEG